MTLSYQQRVGAVLLNPSGEAVGDTDAPLVVQQSSGVDAGVKNAIFTGSLTDDGLAGGNDNPIGNYASAATWFYYTATENVRIWRMLIHIQDSAGMASVDYGNITGGLTNGIVLAVVDSDGTGGAIADGTRLVTLTDFGNPIKHNSGWGKHCYDVAYENVGNGNDFLNSRWTFANSGVPIRLTTGQHLGVLLNDDLSGLIAHHFLLQGHYERAGA